MNDRIVEFRVYENCSALSTQIILWTEDKLEVNLNSFDKINLCRMMLKAD